MRIAIIGAGISGIATAAIFQKAGHEVFLFEKSNTIGGVWALAYPNVQLQNIGLQYHIADFPYPFPIHLHPTGKEVMDYLQAAVAHFKLNVHTNHEVVRLSPQTNGWDVEVQHQGRTTTSFFDKVVSSVGQYTEGKNRPEFDGEASFGGRILTERDVKSIDEFKGKKVAVVGFGKSALDMATFAGKQGAQVTHIFRSPRWTIPFKVLGIHYTHPLFSRFGSVMMPSWAHPTAWEQKLHKNMQGLVNGFWAGLSALLATQAKSKAWFMGKDARKRVSMVIPTHPFTQDLRSAAALEPIGYYKLVAAGRVHPKHAELSGFSPTGLVLSNGETVQADIVVLSLGSKRPIFPFLPDTYRQMLEHEADGVQLYRHILHPAIPNFAFAGYNHGFMHVPAAEVGAVWLLAYWSGDLELPSAEQMEACMAYVRDWKRAHITFEPSRSCAINTRYQQYLDCMLQEIGVSPYRKSNLLAEVFGRYVAKDYAGVYEEYQANKAKRSGKLQTLPIWT